MIGIINYGIGNIRSVENMFKKAKSDVLIIKDPKILNERSFNKLVLPGVGSFDNGMKLLSENGWIEPLNDIVSDQNNTILGICLGMQLFFPKSEEGVLPGLGWIDGEVKKFEFSDENLKIPHMGWNIVNPKEKSLLFEDFGKESRFYFVHSYYVKCKEKFREAYCNYGFNFEKFETKERPYLWLFSG